MQQRWAKFVVAAVLPATILGAGCGSTARSATPAPSTTLAGPATTLGPGPAPVGAFPKAVGEALEALSGHTTFAVNGPTKVDSTAPLSALLNSGTTTATTTTAKAGGYSVELFACPGGVSYPIGDTTINAHCDTAAATVAGFGALALTSEPAAASALPGIVGTGGSAETACPPSSSSRVIDHVTVLSCGTPGSPKVTWTSGQWTIVFHLDPGEAVSGAVGPLIERLATESLPPDTGWLDVDEGGDGAHTTGVWADGPVVRTVFDYHSAVGAADLAVSSRDLAG